MFKSKKNLKQHEINQMYDLSHTESGMIDVLLD